jgi:hypothetical protein
MGAALFSGSAGPVAQVSRLLGSAASLGEAAADTGAKVLAATSDMATSISGFAAAAAQNSLALSTTAWRGVDVLEIVGSRCDGIFAVDSPEIVTSWLAAPQAQMIAPCVDENLIAFTGAAADAVGRGVPVLESTTQDLDIRGKYGELHVRASLAATGQIVIQYSAVNLSFVARWANPVWATLDFPVSQEKAQVLDQLDGAKRMIPVRVVDWNAGEAIAYHAPRIVRLVAAWRRWVRSWCLCVAQTFQLLGLNSWNGWGTLVIFCQTMMLIYYATGIRFLDLSMPYIPALTP